MGAKAIYTDERRKTIHQLIITKDIEKIRGVLHDRDEYRQFSSGWKAVNLDEYVSKFGISNISNSFNNNMRKITFFKDGKQYAIITAIGGKYFRVGEVRADGRIGRYLTLDLKDPSIPGTFQGAARRAENFRLTHFRITHKKGTV
jgi:hypothetical protein